jgi:hypothetical protein
MRDSVVTSAGVARLHEAESELKDVTSQLKRMPTLLPTKIQEVKREIRKAKQQEGYLRQGVLAEEREVTWRRGAAEKEREAHKEEEAMQAKVNVLDTKPQTLDGWHEGEESMQAKVKILDNESWRL